MLELWDKAYLHIFIPQLNFHLNVAVSAWLLKEGGERIVLKNEGRVDRSCLKKAYQKGPPGNLVCSFIYLCLVHAADCVCPWIPCPSGENPLHPQNPARTTLLWIFPNRVTRHAHMCTHFHKTRCLPLALCSVTSTHSKDICWVTFTYHMSHTVQRAGGTSQNETDEVSFLLQL